jgi:hypothetical protein
VLNAVTKGGRTVLRKELKLATVKLFDTILNSGTYALLEKLKGAGATEVSQAEILETYAKYIQYIQEFDDAELELAEIMGLGFLNNAKFWATLLRKDKKSRKYHLTGYRLIKDMFNHLPKLNKLLERQCDHFLVDKENEENGVSMSTLSLIVIEEGQLSSPDRLVLALQSVGGLYRACASFLGQQGNDLCVVGCDSGSDKAFDFMGTAGIVECVKQVLLSYWDKVVSFRDDKTGRYVELIAKSLPIIDEVELMRESGKLEPEQAEIIKRQLTDSIMKFASAGVTIPEIEEFTVYSPRHLLQPEQKLLVEPARQEPEPQMTVDF